MIIAVDFDGTLCSNKYPQIGEPNLQIIEQLKCRRQRYGDKIILWTCRCEDDLVAAVNWCKQFGLLFDAVNENLFEMNERFHNNSRKVFADEYWDDKAVNVKMQ